MSAYSCPFCPVVVDTAEDRLRLALVCYETHLDVHMERGDHLRASA